MKSKLILILIPLLAFFITVLPGTLKARATEETNHQEIFRAEIISVLGTYNQESPLTGETETKQNLKSMLLDGPDAGQTIDLDYTVPKNTPPLSSGQLVLITKVGLSDQDSGNGYQILEISRDRPLLILFGLFAALAILVAGLHGITALLSMFYSFFIIFKFLLPQILGGSDPVFTALLAAFLIAPVTFYLSHGFNKKSHTAIAGTLVALTITGILAVAFVNLAGLSGLASEEAYFVRVQNAALNIRGLLLAGIIIGALGILDDITVSQASVVFALKKANQNLKFSSLFTRAMVVGRDHIASLVNTLILVYTGASLPLLLLFIDSNYSFITLISFEIVAEEIVRTLVASIGLIIAVPITTLVAALLASKPIPSNNPKTSSF